MRITIAKRNIELNGQIEELSIGIIVGWHWPCLSLIMPDLTINYGLFDSVFMLMGKYTRKDIELDNYIERKDKC